MESVLPLAKDIKSQVYLYVRVCNHTAKLTKISIYEMEGGTGGHSPSKKTGHLSKHGYADYI